jgi:hypothetical protein
MDEQFDQLVSYIKQHLEQGVPEDHIRQLLHQHNWNPELVDRAFSAVKAPAPPTYQQPTSFPQSSTSQPQAYEQQPQQPVMDSFNQPSPNPTAPQKYRVFRAIGDAFHAISNNAGTFILSVIISYAVAVGSLFLISLITSKVLYGQYGLLFASTSKLLIVLFGSLILYTVWYAFADAFVLAATSLAIFDGSEKRKSAIATTITNSFARVGRVITANVLFALVSFWPIVLIIFLPIIFLTSGHTGGSSSLILIPVLMLVAVLWAYIALIRFALAPYVALFEPDIPITKVRLDVANICL